MTKKEYLKNTGFPELANKVLKQIGVRWSDLVKYPNDYRDASAGVSGFIYYTETNKFAADNYELISETVRNHEIDIGYSRGYALEKPEDKTEYYNWLSWFALEFIVSDIMDHLENK